MGAEQERSVEKNHKSVIAFNWGLYSFAFTLGLISLFKGHVINGIKQILSPILYWRFPEFSECVWNIDSFSKRPLKVLDIASPKLLSLFLALKRGHTVFTTDLQDKEIFRRYKQYFDDWRSLKNVQGEYFVE